MKANAADGRSSQPKPAGFCWSALEAVVAVAPCVLGWLTCAIKDRAGQCFHFVNLSLILLVFILFSCYNYFLFSNQIYLQILFGFILFRYELPVRRTCGQ